MWKNRRWKRQITGGRVLEEYQQRAEKYVSNPTLLSRLLDKTQKYLGETITRRVAGVASLIQDVPVMLRMTRHWVRGRYRQVSMANMILIVAGLLYFVSPFDLIPDFIGIGFLDDVAILGMIMSRTQQEVASFRKWEIASR